MNDFDKNKYLIFLRNSENITMQRVMINGIEIIFGKTGTHLVCPVIEKENILDKIFTITK